LVFFLMTSMSPMGRITKVFLQVEYPNNTLLTAGE
jgi:hypothetical protein